jgi:hypothetical protein
MLVGFAVNPVYGFWAHVGAGLTLGGGLLYVWHSSNTDWVLIAFASLVFIALAASFRRSSYAVLGAIGLFLATSHFVDEWFGSPILPFFFGANGPDDNPVAQALSYAVLGGVLMLIGLWLARREPAATES